MTRDRSYRSVAITGLGTGLDAALGVNRNVALGLYADLLPMRDPASCPDCSPVSLGGGAFVRYHLVQGLKFDPWASYGVGFRTLGISPDGNTERYVGVEWLRITFGGDWYPSDFLGLGPYLELGAGNFLSVPADRDPGGTYFHFQSGLRVNLDLSGR